MQEKVIKYKCHAYSESKTITRLKAILLSSSILFDIRSLYKETRRPLPNRIKTL